MKFPILLFQYRCYLWARRGTCCGQISTGGKGKRVVGWEGGRGLGAGGSWQLSTERFPIPLTGC